MDRIDGGDDAARPCPDSPAAWAGACSIPPSSSVPIVVVVFSLFRSKHLIADLPIWAIALLVGGCYLLTVLEAALWPEAAMTGWRLQFRVGTVLAAITIVIYSVGWGPTLALGLLFGVADCMRNLGSRVARPAMVFSVLFIGIGQLAIATGIVPTLVAQPFVHGLAALAALGHRLHHQASRVGLRRPGTDRTPFQGPRAARRRHDRGHRRRRSPDLS